MDFRQSLLPASFRGVRFDVVAADTTVGRRTVQHEFPLRDLPAHEDLGRKASEFVVEGFLVGDDYIDRMKMLMAALMQGGPGTLIHPSLGSMQVVLQHPGKLREQFIERRGIVTFSLTFSEDGDLAQPSTETDTQLEVDLKADDCYAPMEADFSDQFSIDGQPAWSIDSITSELNRISDVLDSVQRSLHFDLSALSRLELAGNLFKSKIVALLATPGALATELTTLVRGFVGLFDFSAAQRQVFGARTGVGRPFDALLDLGSYGKAGTATARPAIPTKTPTRRRQAANQDAVFALLSRAAVVEAARASIYVPFDSADQAASMRDRIYDALDDLMLDASDDVFSSLQALRGAVVRDITVRGAEASQLSSMTLTASMPALALSYRLYGSLDYADELVARNQAPGELLHPLFMPGGTPIEVRNV